VSFRPYDGERIEVPAALDRDATVERIHAAKFREPPRGGAALTEQDIAMADVRALQEPGTRPACPLPYEFVVNADVNGEALTLTMEARADAFGAAAKGAPFNVYSYKPAMMTRAYAVRAGDVLMQGGARSAVTIDVGPTHGWYDFTVDAGQVAYRYAGRVESGAWSVTDPAMG
jgi:phospholipase C